MAMVQSKGLLAVAAVAVVFFFVAFHFRYRFLQTELRRGTLVQDRRTTGADCHLVDTQRAADAEWRVTENFSTQPHSDEVFAKMRLLSDGLEASFCKEHPELIDHEVAVVGVRATGADIGQDCANRSCFRWVRLYRE